MPLELEVYTETDWKLVGNVTPGKSGSMSDNKGNGCRDIYVFECWKDDLGSTFYRSISGIDAEINMDRIISHSGLEVIHTLRRGDEAYELEVKTDKSPIARRIRFIHR
ncbi:MAG: hypothetical protein AABX19_03835 [Nanoarchaeota archaeon]